MTLYDEIAWLIAERNRAETRAEAAERDLRAKAKELDIAIRQRDDQARGREAAETKVARIEEVVNDPSPPWTIYSQDRLRGLLRGKP